MESTVHIFLFLQHQIRRLLWLSRLLKGKKVKVRVLAIVLLIWEDSWTAELYSLGSGSWSWLAWASSTCDMQRSTAHDSRQLDLWCSMTDIPLGLHPIAHGLLLINWPSRDGMLNWNWYRAATGRIQTRDLAISSPALGHSVPGHT